MNPIDQTNSGLPRLRYFEPRAFEPLAHFQALEINYHSIAIYVPADKYDIQIHGPWAPLTGLRFRLAFPPLVFIASMLDFRSVAVSVPLQNMKCELYRLCGDIKEVGSLCVERFTFLNAANGQVCMGHHPEWKSNTPLEQAREMALHFFGSVFGGDDRTELCMNDDIFHSVSNRVWRENTSLLEHWERLTEDGVQIPWIQVYHMFLSRKLST